MLDSCVNQGLGLRGIALQAAPRILSLASHGDRQGELPLLWNLCATWTSLGYTVLVLDATTPESERNQGLEQLLDNTFRPEDMDEETTAWSILPAATGFAALCRAHGPRDSGSVLDHLGALFHHYDVVLLYAKADTLASTLPQSGLCPVLGVSGKANSVLTAYQALKHMVLNGKLQPVIVSIAEGNDPAELASADSLGKSLQACAMNFLGHHATALTAQTCQAEEGGKDMNQLALRLMERSVVLQKEAPVPPWFSDKRLDDLAQGSH